MREGTGRAAPDLADDWAEMVADDDLPEFFVTGVEGVQVVVVEEMAERAVADVVHERRDAEKFFDIVRRGNLLDRFFEKRIEMPCKAACHVHGAERVDEAGVFRRGVDPSGALELIDIPEALDPGGVDQVFFSPFVWVRNGERHGEGDVLVDRIGDQRRPIVRSSGLMTEFRHGDAIILAYILRGRQWLCLVRVGVTADIWPRNSRREDRRAPHREGSRQIRQEKMARRRA